MAREKKDTVAETERIMVAPAAGALTIPDFMKSDKEALATNADFDRTQIQLPQLKICQSLTPERKPTKPEFIEGLVEGQLFNKATTRIYPKGPVKFVMLKFWTNITRSNADKTAMVCRAPGGNCACSEDLKAGKTAKGTTWGPNGEKPPCTLWFNYLFYLIDTEEVVWFSAKTTALKKMKNFHQALRNIAGIPDFAKVFTLTSVLKTEGQNEWFVPEIPKMPIGIITNQALYEDLKSKVIDFAEKEIDTSEAEHSDVEEGEVATGPASSSEKPF
jgi:hypothetical protein